MLKYVELETEKSSIPSVLALHNRYSGQGEEFGKLWILKDNGGIENVSNEDISLVNNIADETSKILISRGLESSNKCHIEFHEYSGDNVPHIFDTLNDSQEYDDIISVYYFISRDFTGGEMDIHRERRDETVVVKTLDTRSSKDDMAKVIILDKDAIHSERPSSGLKQCLVVFMKYD